MVNEKGSGQAPEMPIDQEALRQAAEFALWLENLEPTITKDELRDCRPEITEFVGTIAVFEASYSLAELHAIVDLRPEDTANYPMREGAKAALRPIIEKLNFLKKETDITPERYSELEKEYRRLSKAVGIINNNKVRHNL